MQRHYWRMKGRAKVNKGLIDGQQIRRLHDSERQAIAKKVDVLAKALDSNRLSDRDKADKQLVEMGDPCLEFLPPVSDDQSPELLMRLKRIRSSHGPQDQQDALLLKPKSPRLWTVGQPCIQSLARSAMDACNGSLVGRNKSQRGAVTAQHAGTKMTCRFRAELEGSMP
jgi:hypothetical protein